MLEINKDVFMALWFLIVYSDLTLNCDVKLYNALTLKQM